MAYQETGKCCECDNDSDYLFAVRFTGNIMMKQYCEECFTERMKILYGNGSDAYDMVKTILDTLEEKPCNIDFKLDYQD